MADAVAAYVGPVTKCSPGAARAEESVKVKLLLRPRGKRPPTTRIAADIAKRPGLLIRGRS